MEFQPYHSITGSKLKEILEFFNNKQLKMVNSRLGTDYTSSANKKRLSCLRTLFKLDFKQKFHVLEQDVENISAQDKMKYQMKISKQCYTIVKNFEKRKSDVAFCLSRQPTIKANKQKAQCSTHTNNKERKYCGRRLKEREMYQIRYS